jgi:hypothetical protein
VSSNKREMAERMEKCKAIVKGYKRIGEMDGPGNE